MSAGKIITIKGSPMKTTYSSFVLTLLHVFSASSMETTTKLDIPTASLSGTPIKAIAISTAGGIQSLVRAQKDDKEIILIGHARVETWSMGPYSIADNETKRLLLPYFEQLRTEEQPTVFLSLDDTETCKKHAELLESVPSRPDLHKPFHCVINGVAHATNYQSGNLYVRCMPMHACYDLTTWDPCIIFSNDLFPNIAEQIKLSFTNDGKTTVPDTETLEYALEKVPASWKKSFLSTDGPFGKFMKVAKERLAHYSSLCTVKEYFILIKQITEQATLLCEQTADPLLSQHSACVRQRLIQTPDNVRSFLALYGATEETHLLDVLCTMIQSRRQVKEVLIDFTEEILVPIRHYQELMLLATLLTATENKLICGMPHDKVSKMIVLLEKAGFEIISTGYISHPSPLANAMMPSSPFTQQEVEEFFGFTQQQEDLPEQSPFRIPIQEAQEQYALGEMARNLADIPQAAPQETMPYTIKLVTCSICKHTVTREDAYLYNQKKKKGICSMSCLIDTMITQRGTKLMRFLQTTENSRVLDHMAALCYMRFITLYPLATLQEGAFYEGNYLHLLRTLETVCTDQQKSESWQKAVALLKPLLISPEKMVTFLRSYTDLRKDYSLNKKKYTKAVARSAKAEQPVFDPKDTLTASMGALFKELTEAFSLPPTPFPYFLRAYYILYQRLSERTGFTPDKLVEALTITRPTKKKTVDLDALLNELT